MSEEDEVSLYPIGDSTQAVEQEAIASLPITTQNGIITLLRKYVNTYKSEETRDG